MIGYAVTVTIMDCLRITGSVHSYKDDGHDFLTAELNVEEGSSHENQEQYDEIGFKPTTMTI